MAKATQALAYVPGVSSFVQHSIGMGLQDSCSEQRTHKLT